jgi:hypothetical protein
MSLPVRSSHTGVEHRPKCVSGAFPSSCYMSPARVFRPLGDHLRQYLRAKGGVSHPHSTRARNLKRLVCNASLSETLVGVGLFFTPGMLAVVYAYFKGRGNIKDGLSKLLTEVSQGYFQPDVGGENIPVAQGELSDLAGDEPLFKALYQWYDLPPSS